MKALPNADNLVQKKSELKILPKSTKIIKYSATYRREGEPWRSGKAAAL